MPYLDPALLKVISHFRHEAYVPSSAIFSNGNKNYAAQTESNGRVFARRQIGGEKAAGQAFTVRRDHHDIGKSID